MAPAFICVPITRRLRCICRISNREQSPAVTGDHRPSTGINADGRGRTAMAGDGRGWPGIVG